MGGLSARNAILSIAEGHPQAQQFLESIVDKLTAEFSTVLSRSGRAAQASLETQTLATTLGVSSEVAVRITQAIIRAWFPGQFQEIQSDAERAAAEEQKREKHIAEQRAEERVVVGQQIDAETKATEQQTKEDQKADKKAEAANTKADKTQQGLFDSAATEATAFYEDVVLPAWDEAWANLAYEGPVEYSITMLEAYAHYFYSIQRLRTDNRTMPLLLMDMVGYVEEPPTITGRPHLLRLQRNKELLENVRAIIGIVRELQNTEVDNLRSVNVAVADMKLTQEELENTITEALAADVVMTELANTNAAALAAADVDMTGVQEEAPNDGMTGVHNGDADTMQEGAGKVTRAENAKRAKERTELATIAAKEAQDEVERKRKADIEASNATRAPAPYRADPDDDEVTARTKADARASRMTRAPAPPRTQPTTQNDETLIAKRNAMVSEMTRAPAAPEPEPVKVQKRLPLSTLDRQRAEKVQAAKDFRYSEKTRAPAAPEPETPLTTTVLNAPMAPAASNTPLALVAAVPTPGTVAPVTATPVIQPPAVVRREVGEKVSLVGQAPAVKRRRVGLIQSSKLRQGTVTSDPLVSRTTYTPGTDVPRPAVPATEWTTLVPSKAPKTELEKRLA
jgi:hypothetical protein